MKQSFLKINEITEPPHSNIWVYPRGTKAQIKSRIKELESLGVESVSFQGELKIDTINVLGKGYVGIVVLCKIGKKEVAVKIRRIDSQRKNLKKEAEFLTITNQINVGPKLLGFSKNFLVIEYLDGEKIGKWINKLKEKPNVAQLKKIIKKTLTDCYKLDKIGLDHGELSNITKHVIVGKKITILDFESSSVNRRVSNVTSATQAFYIGSGISKIVNPLCKPSRKSKIISVLRKYKTDQTKENFLDLLKVLNL